MSAMYGQPQNPAKKIYGPETLDEYRDARNHQLSDPDNVDIIFTSELMDAVIVAVTALQVQVAELDPKERRAV